MGRIGAGKQFTVWIPMLHKDGVFSDGKAIPWRLNVFMNPPILMTKLEEPSALPTISVRGQADPWAFASVEIPKSLSNILELEHEDGHEFPVTVPCATAIYERIASEMRKACGLSQAVKGSVV